jgi:beta-glucosidase
VEEGNVAVVMTSYNLVNGIHASQNDVLNNKILKDNWKFKGFVVSDWISTYDGVACAKGGLDLEMPSAKFMNAENLIPAIQDGTLPLSVIDDKIRRILTDYDRFGLLEKADISKGYIFDEEKSRSVALNAAREGIVLLKNDHNFLPLDVKKIKSIAVIGPNAFPAVTGGGGSSLVETDHSISLLEAIKQQVGDNVKVTYNRGISTGEELPDGFFNNFNFYIKDSTGKRIKGVSAEFYNNEKLLGNVVTTKTFDRLNLQRESHNISNISAESCSARFTCYFSPEETADYLIAVAGDDGYRLFVDGQKVIDDWKTHGEKVNKYHAIFEKGREYKFVVEYFQSGGDAVIRLASQKRVSKVEDKDAFLNEALENAKKADLVILSVGFDSKTESEGFDRDFVMPYDQNGLISRVASVNPNALVVLNAGGNVDMNDWIDKVKGLLHAWYPGQEGATAVAEIIFGKTNPSGKLPVSFEYKPEDNPTFKSYWDDDKDLKVNFSEGIFIGYRHYDKSNVKPRFPFGYGLSYTTFKYGNLNASVTHIRAGDTLKFSVDVTNTGKVDGAEAVQVYVADLKSSLPRPVKELKSFGKVFLNKGQTKTIPFELDEGAFSFYDPLKHCWVTEPGEFTVMIGSSSVDIRQKFKVILK